MSTPIEYAIVVKNKTRLEGLIERFNTKAQAKFYIERLGGNFDEYELEHRTFYEVLDSMLATLSTTLKYKVIEREFVSRYLFSDKNLILVVGRDGLVANTAKYANEIPILGVNPDPNRYDGVLLPFDQSNFIVGIEQVLQNTYQSRYAHFAEAKLNDGQRLLGFNDLFIGASSHVSARYRIIYKDMEEEHSSSGVIVSTQAGSTGWLTSIFNMAYGVTGLFETDLKLKHPNLSHDQLLFVAREPFKSVSTQADLVTGIFRKGNSLILESLMPQNGVIFSDGIEKDFLKFNSGAIAEVGLASERANLVLNMME